MRPIEPVKLNPEQKELIKKINDLKKEKNAVILVHNYQTPDIYYVGDFIGDSLELARKASQVESDVIVFAGVDFMAETAYILNPGKKVLLPTYGARCPMAAMVDEEQLRRLKEQYPNAAVVSYVNTTAETKAETDICCTSANAIKVVQSLPEDIVIFTPDKNLANYVAQHTEKKIIPWKGFCYVHNKMSAEMLRQAKLEKPDAKVIVHPECPSEIIELADYVESTSQMVTAAQDDPAKEFIIGTEIGMIYRLQELVPDKTFYSVPPTHTCLQMKKNTLQNIYDALVNDQHVITVPEDIRVRAQKSLERMLEVV